MPSTQYANGPLKRSCDIAVAILLLPLAGIIIFLMAAAIRLESVGNPFFCQTRVGRSGREFRLWKMRTLYSDKFIILDRDAELDAASDRITRVGRWLRRSKLDELPQLWNVLVGQMSIIGPRPDIPNQVSQYTGEQRERLNVKPGLTGAAQISGNTLHSWDTRIKIDRWYIARASLSLDLRIIVWTLVAIWSGEDENADPLGAVSVTSRTEESESPSLGNISE